MRAVLTIALALLTGSAIAQQVGDHVLTRPPGVALRDGDTVVASVPQEKWLKVVAVEGDRVWVKFENAVGFVDRAQVVHRELAIEYYTEKIDREPIVADLRERASLYQGKSEFTLALTDLDEALRLDPNDANAYADRALIWLLMRDPDRALEDFAEALRIDPSLARVYNSRATVWATRGDFDRAFADVDESIRLQPRRASAYHTRGMLRLASGQTGNAAMADLDQALSLDPDGPTGAHSYAARGAIQENEDRFEEAIASFAEAIRIDPRCEHAHGHLAWLLATCPDRRFRNGPQALRHAEASCRLTYWKDAKNLQALAAAHAECGDFHSAVVWQNQSLELTPRNERDARDWEILALYESGQPYRQGHFERMTPLEAPKP